MDIRLCNIHSFADDSKHAIIGYRRPYVYHFILNIKNNICPFFGYECQPSTAANLVSVLKTFYYAIVAAETVRQLSPGGASYVYFAVQINMSVYWYLYTVNHTEYT